MDDLPRTVADPRAWMRFTLSLFPAVGGAWGIAVTLLAALTAGSLETIGGLGLVALAIGLLVGALAGLVCGAVDGILVTRAPVSRLRWATALANAALSALIALLVVFEPATRNIIGFLAVVVGPAVTIGVMTFRRSPEARRITG